MNEPLEKADSLDLEFDLASAVVHYCRWNGDTIETDHLLQGLPVTGGELSEALLRRAVGRYGYTVAQKSKVSLEKISGPCLIKTTEGHYLFVVKRQEGAFLCKDSTTPDGVIRVEKADAILPRTVDTLELRKTLSALKEYFGVLPRKGHWFWGLIASQKRLATQITLASMIANILAVTVSLFALQVYDRVIPGQSEATLWVLAIGALIAVAFEAALRIARTAAIDSLGAKVENRLSKDLMAKVLGMSIDKRPMDPALTVNTIREFSSVKEFFTAAAVGVIADLPFAFLFLVLIYFIASNVVFVIIAGAILVITPSLLLRNRMKTEAEENTGTLSAANRILTEASYSLEAVKVDQGEAHFQGLWEKNLKLAIHGSSRQRLLSSMLTFWGTSVQQVTYIGGVIVGVYMVFAGELSIGSIIAVSILTSRTLSPVSQLSQILAKWQNMKSALKGLEALMNAEQDREEHRDYISRPRLRGDIRIKGLQYAHQGSNNIALNIEEFHLKPGDRCALIGKNGAGKTTLLRVAAGLISGQTGEVTLDGLERAQIDPIDLRRNIYFLPQDVKLFNGTLRENLNMDGRYLRDDHILEALSFSGLGDFVRLHSEGLDMKVGDIRNLSAGQRQSIGLARAYLRDPAILIMDEPTSALDQGLEQVVVSRLDKWIGNRTCLLATHRPMILSMVQNVAIMEGGGVRAFGPREEVLRAFSRPNIHAVSTREQ